MSDSIPGFGDNVRIRSNLLTEQLGLAGLTGSVSGETTPSLTGVEVIGVLNEDFALSVMFDERDEQLWFARDLVEFVDHAPGTEIIMGDLHLIRGEAGEWVDASTGQPPKQPGFISWLRHFFRGRR